MSFLEYPIIQLLTYAEQHASRTLILIAAAIHLNNIADLADFGRYSCVRELHIL